MLPQRPLCAASKNVSFRLRAHDNRRAPIEPSAPAPPRSLASVTSGTTGRMALAAPAWWNLKAEERSLPLVSARRARTWRCALPASVPPKAARLSLSSWSQISPSERAHLIRILTSGSKLNRQACLRVAFPSMTDPAPIVRIRPWRCSWKHALIADYACVRAVRFKSICDRHGSARARGKDHL